MDYRVWMRAVLTTTHPNAIRIGAGENSSYFIIFHTSRRCIKIMYYIDQGGNDKEINSDVIPLQLVIPETIRAGQEIIDTILKKNPDFVKLKEYIEYMDFLNRLKEHWDEEKENYIKFSSLQRL
jgi:hypothetical protein